MSVVSCEYELLPPGPGNHADPPEAADSDLRTHLYTTALRDVGRRFAFSTTYTAKDGTVRVFTRWMGWQNRDDSVVILDRDGRPCGWYLSVASAHAHLRAGAETLWLTWLEPSPEGS
ncbi:MAG: hypothetical protein ACRDXX_09920 [Stackebrandtia sp.]